MDKFSNIFISPLAMLIFSKNQPLKTEASIVSTLAGISIEVKDVQCAKAPLASDPPLIVFRCAPSSKVTVVKEEHPLNAFASITSIFVGISIILKGKDAKVLAGIAVNLEPFSNITRFNCEQPLKVVELMVSTFAGIVTRQRLEQPLNVSSRVVNPVKCCNSLNN